jgi:hypothetical protein
MGEQTDSGIHSVQRGILRCEMQDRAPRPGHAFAGLQIQLYGLAADRNRFHLGDGEVISIEAYHTFNLTNLNDFW